MDTIALVPNNSLITETPEEGRQLAVKLARLIIKLTQQFKRFTGMTPKQISPLP